MNEREKEKVHSSFSLPLVVKQYEEDNQTSD